MTYNELQKKAADLGMEKVVGVKTADLEAYIANHSKVDGDALPTMTNEVGQTESSATTPEYNAASVRSGKNEIRRYTLETHGESFVKLAEGFADKKGYEVVMLEVEPQVECPSCGHKFDL